MNEADGIDTTPARGVHRRGLLTATAALIAGAAVVTAGRGAPAVDGEGADAELIAVCRQFLAVDAEIQRVQMAGAVPADVMDALNDRYYPPLERLIELPARTPVGLHLKAAAACAAMMSVADELQREEQAGLSVLRDMAGDTVALRSGIALPSTNVADATLLALCAGFQKQHAVVDAVQGDEDALNAAMDVRWSLSDRIKSTPPTTLTGLRAKAAVGLRLLDENRGPDPDGGDADAAFAYAVLRDLATETPEIGS